MNLFQAPQLQSDCHLLGPPELTTQMARRHNQSELTESHQVPHTLI